MATGYFAEVVDGIVTAVIKATPDFIASYSNLSPSTWVEVLDMESYPGIGYTWDGANGFQSPPQEPLIDTVI
jgi:hypothetical protein